MAFFDDWSPEQRRVAAGALLDIGNIWTRSGQQGAAPNGLINGGNLQKAFTRNAQARRDQNIFANDQLMRQQLMAKMQAAEAARRRNAEMQRMLTQAYQVPGSAPEAMGPPTPQGQMQMQPGTSPRAPQTMQERMAGYGRMENLMPGAGLEHMKTMADIQKAMRPSSPLVVQYGDQLRNLPEEFDLMTRRNEMEMLTVESTDARKLLSQAERGLNLLRYTSTGAFEPMKAEIAKWLGVAPEMVANAEIWNDLSTELALQHLQMFKGPSTDFEYKKVRDLAANQGKNAFTSFVALEAQRRASIRATKRRSSYNRFLKHSRENPNDTRDIYQWFDDEIDTLPDFDLKQLRAQYERQYLGKVDRGNGGKPVLTDDDMRDMGYFK